MTATLPDLAGRPFTDTDWYIAEVAIWNANAQTWEHYEWTPWLWTLGYLTTWTIYPDGVEGGVTLDIDPLPAGSYFALYAWEWSSETQEYESTWIRAIDTGGGDYWCLIG